MKKKVLSMLICTAMAVSQTSMISTVANADDAVNSTNENTSTGATTGETTASTETGNSTTPSAVLLSANATMIDGIGSSTVDNIIEAISPDIIVDKQYTGTAGEEVNGIRTYSTVAAAIASIDASNAAEKIIFIKNGIYKEKLNITTPNITLVGESAERTILTYDDAAGTIKRTADGGNGTATYGTTASASITITSLASKFKAANLTISNSFDEAANSTMSSKQAVAMKNEADNSVFVNCKFLGNQDTLYANKNKQYYYNCFISGDVDFIFGGAQAVFENCEMKSVNRDGITPKGYVTAPSTLESSQYRFLMLDCKLTSNISEAGSVYLGRPWHPSSVTVNMISNAVYKNCYLGPHVATYGWITMSNNGTLVYPANNDMFEYENYGAGAVINDSRTQLTDSEANNKYNKQNVLSGWDATTAANILSSYKEDATDYDSSEAYDDYMEAADTIDTDQEIADAKVAFEASKTSTSSGGSTTPSTKNIAEQVDWNFTRFGASTSEKNNIISIDDINKTVTLTSGSADGTSTGGKITGSNDGISYYYTEIDPSENFVLSATVKVNYFEKTSPDNQCGFGIMARDTIGTANDSSVFSSNMVLVGGYRANIQSVYRTGVTADSSGTITMQGLNKFANRPANDGTSVYKLTLKKTNTGYLAAVDDGKEVTYYAPKLLEVVDNKIYVGFCTARVASITVSDINLTKSEVATDPAGESAPAETIAPAISVTSTSDTSDTNYNLKLQPNVDGIVNVKHNGTEIYNGSVSSSSELTLPSTLSLGENKFDIVYTPSVTANNTNTTPIAKTFTVNVKSYGVEKGNVYVSQEGTSAGDGKIENPIDIYTAVKYAGKEQTIKVKGGIYNLTSPITIEKSNNGAENSMKTLESYDGSAIFNFGKMSQGLFLNGSYWHVKGVDVTNTLNDSAGFRVAGSHNIVENVNTYKNGNTGLQISSVATTDAKSTWPSYNTILNCTSYDNMDAAMNNADGFAAKLTCGEGNVFKGCISHNNCDDGWDLFSKLETGTIGAVTIDGCIAYGNGTLTDGTVTSGDGNGFKLGGEGLPVKHKLENSLSFGNNSAGVTSNSNPSIIVENCMSADNDVNYSLDYYTNAALDFEFNKDKSFQTSASSNNDVIIDSVKGSTNYFYNGTTSENADGEQLTVSMFKSTQMPTSIERDVDNNIVWPDYMTLINSSTGDSGNNNTGDSSDTNTGDSGNNNTGGSSDTNTGNSGNNNTGDSSDTKTDNGTTNSSTGTNDSSAKNSGNIATETQGNWNQNSDGTWSFINSEREKAKGWIKVNNIWYNLNSTGIMQTGWFKDTNEKWYYLNSNGTMQIGWKQLNGYWYLMKDNGAMATGWQKENGIWYLLKDDGSMSIGWKQSNGEWYYFNTDGSMASNTTIDGYTLGENGAMV